MFSLKELDGSANVKGKFKKFAQNQNRGLYAQRSQSLNPKDGVWTNEWCIRNATLHTHTSKFLESNFTALRATSGIKVIRVYSTRKL